MILLPLSCCQVPFFLPDDLSNSKMQLLPGLETLLAAALSSSLRTQAVVKTLIHSDLASQASFNLFWRKQASVGTHKVASGKRPPFLELALVWIQRSHSDGHQRVTSALPLFDVSGLGGERGLCPFCSFFSLFPSVKRTWTHSWELCHDKSRKWFTLKWPLGTEEKSAGFQKPSAVQKPGSPGSVVLSLWTWALC